ncbi:MAG: leucine-rich repeat protein [Prevotella sp.]|nr:leucine-rich repeat domain-containing protein [Prevotella sp.]MDY4217417.1 leucine-rich repeat protein [Prevotella sp.]
MKQTKLLFLLLLLMAIPATMQAYIVGETVEKDGLYYRVLDITNFNVSFLGTKDNVSGTLTIPSQWSDGKGTTFTVREIGGDETYRCKNITKVIMPTTITKIKSASFSAAKLEELNIPASVVEISNSAFYNIGTLPKVTVDPSSTYFISDNDGALYSHDKKKLYTVPSAIAPAGGTYTVDAAVENISNGAFTKAKDITKITLPANLQNVETGFPSFVTSCINLAAFEMTPNSTSPFKVMDGVLFNNHKLIAYPQAKPDTDYKVPNGVTEIVERGIESNRFMKTIDLNEVTKLNKNSIVSNWELQTVTLPKNLQLTDIEGAINENRKISEYKAPADCVNFDVIDGIVYSKGDHSILYFFPPAKPITDGKYTVEPFVKVIGNQSFSGNRNIIEITFPQGLEKINDFAFKNSALLEKITFLEPSNVNSLGVNAFGWCPNLKIVTIPTSLTELRNSFMYSDNLETIIVPNGSKLTNIRGNALSANKNLKKFIFEGSCELTSIGESAFSGTKLESFNFPKGVTTIGSNAFNKCSNMTTVKFDENAIITTIGAGAFADCGITSIDIPNSVTKLDREAFRNCTALTTVNISKNLTNISSEAFKYCKNLVDINVDKNNPAYSSVDGYLLTKNKETLVLFPHGKAHAKFTLLPPSITKIGDYAFYECENLTSVMIPNKVTSIGARAFSLCKNLKDIAFLCDHPIPDANINHLTNHKSFDDGTAGTTNMPSHINIYVRKELKSEYEAHPFFNTFKSIQPSFIEDGNEYLQVAATVVDLLSVKNENHTFVIPEKTHSGLEVGLIGDYAFQSASNKIKEVVVKNHIEYVGAKAFMTNINDNSSTIENVFFINKTPSKKMLSTTRFELDETGKNYKEFASTTKIYVKKSVAEEYKTKWKKQMWDIATGMMKDSPDDYQFYNQIDYKIKGTPALANKLYSTFSREFDVDFGDIDESSNRLFWDNAENCPKVIAFTSGEKIGNSVIRMKSINLGSDKAKDGLYVPANTGVVLKAIDGTLPTDFYYRIGEDDIWSYSGANILKPVTVDAKDIVATEGGNTNFYISDGKAFRVSQAQQFKSKGKLTIGVHKAYININVPAGAKLSLLFGDDETTGIEEVNPAGNTAPGADNTYHNLNGQRVSKPAKGIYIHNGKKVTVK